MEEMGPQRPLTDAAQQALEEAAKRRNTHAHPGIAHVVRTLVDINFSKATPAAEASLRFLLSCLRGGTKLGEIMDIVEGVINEADSFTTSQANLNMLARCLPVGGGAEALPLITLSVEAPKPTEHGWLPPALRCLDADEINAVIASLSEDDQATVEVRTEEPGESLRQELTITFG